MSDKPVLPTIWMRDCMPSGFRNYVWSFLSILPFMLHLKHNNLFRINQIDKIIWSLSKNMIIINIHSSGFRYPIKDPPKENFLNDCTHADIQACRPSKWTPPCHFHLPSVKTCQGIRKYLLILMLIFFRIRTILTHIDHSLYTLNLAVLNTFPVNFIKDWKFVTITNYIPIMSHKSINKLQHIFHQAVGFMKVGIITFFSIKQITKPGTI